MSEQGPIRYSTRQLIRGLEMDHAILEGIAQRTDDPKMQAILRKYRRISGLVLADLVLRDIDISPDAFSSMDKRASRIVSSTLKTQSVIVADCSQIASRLSRGQNA